jgi:hypothetical protein
LIFANLRRAAPLQPRYTGLLALLSTGALAALGTQLLCAKDDLLHVLLWHAGPLALTALLGVSLGDVLLRRRA